MVALKAKIERRLHWRVRMPEYPIFAVLNAATARLGRLSAMRELIGGEYGKRDVPEGQFSISDRRQP